MLQREAWADSMASGLLMVDLDALVRNYRTLSDLAPGSRCAAVVKADAYGLGLAPVARALEAAGCTDFFVATAEEGRELRALLPEARICVFNGPTPASLRALLEARLVPVLNSPAQLRLWSEPAEPRPCLLHLDTGMHRLGLTAAEARDVVAAASLLGGLRIEQLMTHLACADEAGNAMNRRQLDEFGALAALWPGIPTSIANSAGILLGREFCGDLVRPGIALYGGFAGTEPRLAEVVALYGRVLQLRDLARPGTVGYGASHRLSPPARLATLGVGYADGYPWSLGNRGYAMAAGVRARVVGRVSMDTVVVELTGPARESVRVGDPVQLLGGGIDLDGLASRAGTIAYEILTGLGRRLERRYI